MTLSLPVHAALAAALVLALGGCASPPEATPRSENSIGRAIETTNSVAISYTPLLSRLSNPEVDRQIALQVMESTAKCMKRSGFSPPSSPEVPNYNAWQYATNYSPSDSEKAYRDSASEHSATESEDWDRAMYGEAASDETLALRRAVEVVSTRGTRLLMPTGGCRYQSLRDIWGDPRLLRRLELDIDEAQQTVQDVVRTSPDFIAALARWSSCMKNSGLSYASPDQLRETVYENAELTPTTTEAPSAIVAALGVDAGCAVGVRLPQEHTAALHQAESSLGNADVAAINQYLRLRDSVRKRLDVGED